MIRLAIIIIQIVVIISLVQALRENKMFDTSSLKCIEQSHRKLVSTTLDLTTKEFFCYYMDEEVKQVKRR